MSVNQLMWDITRPVTYVFFFLYSIVKQLQVGVEFEASTRMQDTSASFGYQLDLPKANLLFKGKYEAFSFIHPES